MGEQLMYQFTQQQYQRLFESLPAKILVLKPESYEIVAVTPAYLQATMTRESELVGKTLFQIFPDDPDDRQADGALNLTKSLQRVEALKTTDTMAVQRYPIRLPDGSFEERFWSPVNSPVLDDAGVLELIVHRVEDVTEIIGMRASSEMPGGSQGGGDPLLVQDIVLQSFELRQALSKLQMQETRMRTAERMFKLGGWEFDPQTGQLNWSREVFDIYDVPADQPAPNFDTYLELVHSDDRQASRSAFADFHQQNAAQIEYSHRVVARDGSVRQIRGVGARHSLHGGMMVVGFVQDITSLRKAQDRAEEAEHQRLDVLESISDAFYSVDENWTFKYLNRQACILLDRPRETLLGKNVWAEFPQAADSEFRRQYEFVLASQQTVRFTEYYPPLKKWLGVSAYPIPGGLAVYFRDVTKERDAQDQLRLIETALSRLNDIVIITEADALDGPDNPRIVYVNEAFERLTGYSKSEVMGRTPRMLQGPQTSRQTLNRIRHALQNNQAVRCEVLNYGKTNIPYWLEIDITPLDDGNGRFTHFVAVERDITERKQREEELKLLQERFQLISKAASDVIWDRDLIADKVWWNSTVTSVFGYAPSELEPGPESWTRRIHPDDRERVLRSIHAVIDGDTEYWNGEYRFIKSDGRSANVLDRGFVIRNTDGKATRMVGSMLDITEREAIEQRLRESQKLEAVGHLTGGIAHDFNNLLTIILGNAEMLSDMVTDPKLRPMAQMTLAAALRGAELTSRLLAFARRQPLDPKPSDVNQLVRAMQELICRTLPESIDLHLTLDHDLGLVEIDAGELDSALLNLVVNARDAMPEGGKLIIESANVHLDSDYAAQHPEVVAGDYVMLYVTDTGTGMDPDTVSRAFEPFFTTKLTGKGCGLGLSMVFGFTKQSGGHIKIYSKLGIGTSVMLYFPRLRAHLPINDQPAVTLLPKGGTEHILIVEDNDLVLKHLEAQLLSLGYRVTTTMSGPQALESLQAHHDIDLLLTDVVMPGGINGRQLADLALAYSPSLKVLFTSGYTENAIVHHGRLDPGIVLLSKPYTRQKLAAKVREVLETDMHAEQATIRGSLQELEWR